MSSVSLNLPSPIIQDQTQLFISPNNQRSTLSCYSVFHILDQSQAKHIRYLRHAHQEDVCNESSTQPKSVMADPNSSECDHQNLSFHKIEDQENRRGNYDCEKWLSSNKAFDIIRVCADCNTTSTPLWRSGPNGPKSLCNACGIRQRKARRAMAEAANGFAPSSSMDAKSRVHHHKEKKCRGNHFAGFKNKSKTAISATARGTLSKEQKVRIDLKDFAINLRDDSALDEVAKAALLLMDLSRGFAYS